MIGRYEMKFNFICFADVTNRIKNCFNLFFNIANIVLARLIANWIFMWILKLLILKLLYILYDMYKFCK